MALSNLERQRKWIAKNRALHNRRRRLARKNLSSGEEAHQGSFESRQPESTLSRGGSVPPTQPSTLDKLRAAITAESTAEPVVKPTIFRDDRGQIITEHQWNEWQKRKAEAKKGNYHLDDYCQ